MPSRQMIRPPAHPAGTPISRRGALALFAAAVPLLAAQPAAAQETRYFRIATGSPGASYFPVGGLIANAISNPPGSRDCDQGGSCGVPGLIAVAQTTLGSVENIELVAAGDYDSGLTQADVAHWAHTGANFFAKSGPVANIAAIANLYQESLNVVVRADSGIESVGDLRGKRVSLGEKDSGTLVTALLVLSAYGLSAKRVKPQYLAVAPACERLQADEIDAFFAVSGHPIAALSELAESTPVRLLPLTGETAQSLRAKHPFFTVDLVPAGVYRDVGGTVTLGIGTLWIVRAEIDPDLVFAITQALWHPTTRKLLDSSAAGRQIRFETALSGIPIPLHPGADRYYKEAGTPPLPVTSQ